MRHLDPFECFPFGQPTCIVDESEAAQPPTAETGARPMPEDTSPPPLDGCLDAAFVEGVDHFLICQAAFREAEAYFATRQPEAACLLLGPRRDEIVTDILVDDEGKATPASFTLAAASLNRKVKPYLAAGLNIKGIWHLHPPGFTSLSAGDVSYARKLFANPKHKGLDRFAMPITAGGRCFAFMLTLQDKALAIRSARVVLL